MEGNLVLAVLVAVVLLLAAFQTIQITEISGKMSGSAAIGTGYAQPQATSSGAQQTGGGSSPTMVGGC